MSSHIFAAVAYLLLVATDLVQTFSIMRMQRRIERLENHIPD